MTKAPFAALIPLAMLAACQTTGTTPAAQATDRSQLAPAFVEAACGGCHGVEPPFFSPNPRAPDFAEMSTRQGVADGPLAEWLADAHNYPEDMDFDLSAEQIEEIVAYMVTLRNRGEEPAAE